MPTLFNKYYPMRKVIFFLGEGGLIFFSLLGVDWFMLGSGLFFLDILPNCMRAALVTLIFQLCLYFFDLYDLSHNLSIPSTVTRMTQSFGIGCVLLGGIYYTIPAMIISTPIFWLGYVVICLAILCWRIAYYLILRRRLFVQDIVVIGTGKFAEAIAREVEGVKDSVYRVCAFIGEGQIGYNPNNTPVHKSLEAVDELLMASRIERIVVALDDRRGATPVNNLLKYKLAGIAVEQGGLFYERITGKVPVEKIAPGWIIFSDGFFLSRWQYQLKRMIDLFLAGFLLMVNIPVFVLTALLIKIESSGPVFYRQERVGEKDRTFRLVKFRSMCTDAEKNGAVWAAEDDSRVTRVGRIIRRLRVDELPQLLNVIRGEMSIVGPRPERRVFVELLEEKIPFYAIRHELKPGITGWAQVCYPYGASEEDALKKLEYDLYYMKNLSFVLDIVIIFKTVKTVLLQKGAR